MDCGVMWLAISVAVSGGGPSCSPRRPMLSSRDDIWTFNQANFVAPAFRSFRFDSRSITFGSFVPRGIPHHRNACAITHSATTLMVITPLPLQGLEYVWTMAFSTSELDQQAGNATIHLFINIMEHNKISLSPSGPAVCSLVSFNFDTAFLISICSSSAANSML